MKLHLNDLALVHATLSPIDSRSDINPFIKDKLPLITAPMDMVIDATNADYFYDQKLNICLPRGLKASKSDYFVSYGLDEVITMLDSKVSFPKRILIDIANGAMLKLYETAKRIKQETVCQLMVGNIANPETYRKYCDILGENDYIRLGIGGGSACTTSANSGVHYPMASLIQETFRIKKENNFKVNIIADGGFRNFDEIIKAIALGADYVMLGSILSKSFESCSSFYYKDYDGFKTTSKAHATKLFDEGKEVYKYYRGMSTKDVQKSWNKTKLKTSEGIAMYNKVEHYLHKWTENFEDYLRTAMSYCGVQTLDEFRDKANFITISEQAQKAYKK
jgi:IMP dehydrogenase/GMP reductase